MKISGDHASVQQRNENTIQRNHQAKNYTKLSPNKKSQINAERRPAPRIKSLGGRIDVRA